MRLLRDPGRELHQLLVAIERALAEAIPYIGALAAVAQKAHKRRLVGIVLLGSLAHRLSGRSGGWRRGSRAS